jgi:hypothetical protein
MGLRQIKASEDGFGLLTYDPSFTKIASCRSDITFVDGERGKSTVRSGVSTRPGLVSSDHRNT